MCQHGNPIPRQPHIGLYGMAACLDGPSEGTQGVLGIFLVVPAVGEGLGDCDAMLVRRGGVGWPGEEVCWLTGVSHFQLGTNSRVSPDAEYIYLFLPGFQRSELGSSGSRKPCPRISSTAPADQTGGSHGVRCTR